MRNFRIVCALFGMIGALLTGCAAMDKDPILGKKQFEPNMNMSQK